MTLSNVATVSRVHILTTAALAIGAGPRATGDRLALYNEITEGRRDWPDATGKMRHYGWCGDFVTWVLYTAGVRNGRLLNRQSLNGKWVPGDNLARIERWARRAGAFVPLTGDPKLITAASKAKPGDIIVFFRSDGDHIAFVEDSGATSGDLVTIDGNSTGGLVSRNHHRSLSSYIRYIVDVDYIATKCFCTV